MGTEMTHMRLRPLLAGVVLRSQSDARLAQLASEGHQPAFTTIFERYQGELVASAAGVVRTGRAEDVVQHAMLNAWSALLSGEVVAQPRAWLHRIVHNIALNTVARRGYDDGEIPQTAASPILTDEVVEGRVSAARALAAVAALPEAQRRALALTAIGGHSASDAAAELGISETAMRQLIYRARSNVRSAVSAVTPLPFILSALHSVGTASAITVGGAGAAGALNAVAVKTAVVVAVAAGGLGASTVVKHDNDHHTRAPHAQKTAPAAPVARTSIASQIPAAQATHRTARSTLRRHSRGSQAQHGGRDSAGTLGNDDANDDANDNESKTGSTSGATRGSAGSNGERGATGPTSSNSSDDTAPDDAQSTSTPYTTTPALSATETALRPNQQDANTSPDADGASSIEPSPDAG